MDPVRVLLMPRIFPMKKRGVSSESAIQRASGTDVQSQDALSLLDSEEKETCEHVCSLVICSLAFFCHCNRSHSGILTPSPRFGSLPKVAFAGMLGYISGKMSYMRVCEEKFRKLENSPLGEALRQGRLHHTPSVLNQSEFEDSNPSESQQSGSESASQRTAEGSSMPESYSSYTSDYTYSRPSQSYDTTPFSSGFSDSGPVNIRDDISQAPLYPDEDVPKKKPVLYEDLRSKNRENYEVTLTQKAETLLKPQRVVPVAKKEVKKNKYGDAWEE
ncbi:OCIA domain-containing protein 1-like isoform X2 [Cyprinus carpio]|uniref:OCIA domain-containing protein 1 n=2 Tax=Cyprinus carpio TaxID=7962 RepID=A0A8C1EJY9_CYPCA|nr:OCIA domain-containing protein 1-like isoform X2 [Cyprinus carpio]